MRTLLPIPLLAAGALLVLGAAPRGAAAAPPLWPLEERTCVTSSFGDRRSDHFHAGIDLSTGGRIGLPIRAVGPGRVVRLRASPYGYGRSLYLDLDDGRQVVYAHLSDFEGRWRDLVVAEQERLGRYTVDIAVADSPRVASGEILGKTGDTGGGPPHLHFEVRRGDAEPINPLVNGWGVADDVAPVIHSIRLLPLGLTGRVDRGMDPVTLSLVRSKRDGAFRPDREVVLSGSVGVEYRVSEKTPGCSTDRAALSSSLRAGDTPLFEASLESLSYFVDFNHVHRAYDLVAYRAGLGEYLRLFDPVTGRGAFLAGAEPETLRLLVTDAAGNSARAEIAARCEAAEIRIVSSAGADSEDEPKKGGGGKEATASKGDPDAPRVTWRLTPDGIVVRAGATFAPRTGSPGSPSHAVGGRAISPPGRVLVFRGTPSGGEFDPDAPVSEQFRLAAWSKRAVWFTGSADDLEPGGPPDGWKRAMATVGWFPDGSRDGTVLARIGPIVRCAAGARMEISPPDDASLRLVIPKGALLAAALVAPTAMQPEGAAPRPKLPAGLTLRHATVRFDPPDQFLAALAEVRFAAGDADAARRLGIFAVASDGSIDAMSTSIDSASGELVARTRTLGAFAVIEDASAPVISRPRPARGAAVTARKPRLSVRVTDAGRGLQDEGVRFTIDGERLIPEYDPEAGIIKAVPRAPLAPGTHAVRVELSDRAGNGASIAWSFEVQSSGDGSSRDAGGSRSSQKPTPRKR